MKKLQLVLFTLIFFSVTLLTSAQDSPAGAGKPNILVIWGDDIGEFVRHKGPGVAATVEGVGGSDVQGQIADVLEGQVVAGCQVFLDHVGPLEGTVDVVVAVEGVEVDRTGLVVPAVEETTLEVPGV